MRPGGMPSVEVPQSRGQPAAAFGPNSLPMQTPWVLVLEPPTADAGRRVGGLSLVLRLALTAQAGSAGAIVLPSGAANLRKELADPRLRIPVFDQPPRHCSSVRIAANYLIHPRLLSAVAGSLPSGDDEKPQLLELRLPPAEDQLLLHNGFGAIEVTDAASARRAETALFQTLTRPADGWTSRWLNRPISLRISRLLVRTPLHPNAISLAILALGLVSAWLASRGTYWSALAGAGCFQLQSILDGCDGEISRVTYRASLLGEWLDTIGDDLTTYGFFLGAAWGLYQVDGDRRFLLAGAVMLLGGLVLSGTQYRYLLRIGSGSLLNHPIAGVPGESGLLTALRPLFRRDTFILLTLLAAMLGLLGPMVIVAAGSTVVMAAKVIRMGPNVQR